MESVPNFPRQGKLLDVGCSSGVHLEVAQKRGWDVYGVEPTEEAAGRASDTALGKQHIKGDEQVQVGRWHARSVARSDRDMASDARIQCG